MLETTRGGPLDTRFREYDKFRGPRKRTGLHVSYYVSYSRKRVSSVPRRAALGFVISMSAAIGMSEADHQPRLTLSLEIDEPFFVELVFP